MNRTYYMPIIKMKRVPKLKLPNDEIIEPYRVIVGIRIGSYVDNKK
jgi:hypothetical protein